MHGYNPGDFAASSGCVPQPQVRSSGGVLDLFAAYHPLIHPRHHLRHLRHHQVIIIIFFICFFLPCCHCYNCCCCG
ncbi:hypothetical protein LINGRAHAP2_LOCUS20081 [Linum grandiflorum]